MLYTSVSHLWISMRNDRKYSNMWRWNWSNIPKIIYPKMLEATDAFWFWQFGCPNLLDPTSLVALLHLSLRWQSLLLIVLASCVARTPTAAGASLQHTWSNQIRESSFDGGAFLLRVCICCYAWAEFDVLTNGTEEKSPKRFATTLGHPRSEWIDLSLSVSSMNEIWLESVSLYKHFVYYKLYTYIYSMHPKNRAVQKTVFKETLTRFYCFSANFS